MPEKFEIETRAFVALQNWYLSHCDGDWEHEFGVKIETLDNPGWDVTIDLIGTDCENKKFDDVDREVATHNWIQCEVRGKQFTGTGGPQNLIDIINVFLTWATSKAYDDEQ